MKLHFLLLLFFVFCATEEVELPTSLGKVTGLVTTVAGEGVLEFRGIPYAKPPVGKLRFAKPEPYGEFPSSGLIATEFGEFCAQSLGILQGGEDCLFLNIYSPQTPSNKSVMLWIHGGGFAFGKSNDFNGAILAASENVVVVTINYRLNIFGFLTTGDDKLPGNYGLWDQRLAIQWVKDNIKDYGGNSSEITIFGESAGARSVGFQLVSPRNSQTLFQRAIMQSGSALASSYINRDPVEVASTVTESLGCPLNAENLIDCLRSKSVSQLQKASNSVARALPFFPTIDNDFLKHDLGLALSNFTSDNSMARTTNVFSDFGNYDILSGWNNQEGLIYMNTLLTVSEEMTGRNLSEGVSEEVLLEALRQWPFINYPVDQQPKEIVVRLLKDYFSSTAEILASENLSIEKKRVEIYSQIAGDLVLKIPGVQSLQVHSATGKEGNAYAYEFTHRRSAYGAAWYDGPNWLRYGADHTDEIPYVFGTPIESGDLIFTDEEIQLSRDMMKMWSSFAKTGNPGEEFNQFEFPRNQTYTVLNTEQFERKTYPLNDVQRLWSAVDSAILQTEVVDVPFGSTESDEKYKYKYLDGMLELTPEEANKVMTVLLILCILFGLVSVAAICCFIIWRWKCAKNAAQMSVNNK
ncbi:acylcarnitine hydrolase-like [Watersipora subatra]|uniref:acylcarnitine hydrolase-like n=1 Tax=Watersipora subatra TaxID=2589382 RepID=UPI00355C84CB